MKLDAPRRKRRLGAGADAELPTSRRVLLLVDFINPLDFPGAENLAPAALAAARATARLKARLGRAGVVTIYANDNYGRWRSDFRALHASCAALPGSPGLIARKLAPRRADLRILKPRHSAFHATPLDLLLTQLQARELVVTGLATDFCVLQTAMEAHMRGLAVWVPADCTAAESPTAHAAALEIMGRTLGASTEASTLRD